jgi:hypothetical protein
LRPEKRTGTAPGQQNSKRAAARSGGYPQQRHQEGPGDEIPSGPCGTGTLPPAIDIFGSNTSFDPELDLLIRTPVRAIPLGVTPPPLQAKPVQPVTPWPAIVPLPPKPKSVRAGWSED